VWGASHQSRFSSRWPNPMSGSEEPRSQPPDMITRHDQKSYRLSGRDAHQPLRGAAEDGDAVRVAEAGRRHHEVDLGAGPREWIVGADHDLANAGLGDQMA